MTTENTAARRLKSEHRTTNETLMISLLCHLGCSSGVIQTLPIKENGGTLGRSSIRRAREDMREPMYYDEVGLPRRVCARAEHSIVRNWNELKNISSLTACMFYVAKEKIYSGLGIEDVLQSYNLYTNLHKAGQNSQPQLDADAAFWLAREFTSMTACAPYCTSCDLRFYSGACQEVRNVCPYCHSTGRQNYYALDKSA